MTHETGSTTDLHPPAGQPSAGFWAGDRGALGLAVLALISCGLYILVAVWSPLFRYEASLLERPIPLVVAFFGVAFVVYLLAIRVAGRAEQNRRLLAVILVASLAYRLILLPSTPLQEIDIYRYLWDGAVSVRGINPFRYAPHYIRQLDARTIQDNDLARLARIRDTNPALRTILLRVHYGELPTVYPPVSQVVFAAAAWTTPPDASVEWRMLMLKIWLCLFDVGTIFLVVWLLRRLQRPVGYCLIYAWCPLLLKEFANSGHLDAIAVFLSTLAVCLTVRLWKRDSGASERPRHQAGQGRGGVRPDTPAGSGGPRRTEVSSESREPYGIGEPGGQGRGDPRSIASVGAEDASPTCELAGQGRGDLRSGSPAGSGDTRRTGSGDPRRTEGQGRGDPRAASPSTLLSQPSTLNSQPSTLNSQPSTLNSQLWIALAAGVVLALAIGAKLFPVVLVPLWTATLVRRLGWLWGLIPLAVCIAATFVILRPFLVRTWPTESPPEVQPQAQPAAETGRGDPAMGLKRFLTRWEMNDFLFLLAVENLKTPDVVREGQRAWFSIYPETARESIVATIQSRFETDRWGAAFLAARGVTLTCYALIAVWLLSRCWRNPKPEAWVEAVFLALAWFWLLSPTLNPWYWTWALPFLPWARSRVWLAMSGCVLVYYLRFWFVYQFPQTPVWGTPYVGAAFFDLIVTWIEFGPWYACLLLGWLWRRSRVSVQP